MARLNQPQGGGKTMNDGVPILRPGEAAELLGVRLSKLRRLEATGRLVTVRTLGGHRRYRQDDVEALGRWLQRQRAA
jgi:excisionase family DNA binding protein